MDMYLTLTELEQYDSEPVTCGEEVRFLCPVCGDNKPADNQHRCLSVNTKSGLWKCHRCDNSGILAESAQTNSRCKNRHGKASLRHRLDECELDPQKISRLLIEMRGAKPLADSPGEAYLDSRGVSVEVAQQSGVLYSRTWNGPPVAPTSGAMVYPPEPCVVFPLRDRQGSVVAATGRSLVGDCKRAYGCLKQGVFATVGALDAATIFIVEGPMDALTLATCGFPAVALCGTSYPEWMRSAVAFRTAVIGTDADVAGDRAAESLTKGLSGYAKSCVRLRPPSPHKDWNEMILNVGKADLSLHLCKALQSVGVLCATVQPDEQ